ncbi:MAG: GntR family transcriptional regulator [Bacteroidales bacterium]|nr:GntR family transcriptional regulator [Bacteroidales bacterium]
MDFKKQKPIYLQIAERLMEQVVQGEFAADGRMPSVREVAASMGVNPNTVARSFDYLQKEEIAYQRRGMGFFVAPEAKERILSLQRREFMEEDLPVILQKMRLLGISLDQLKEQQSL